LVEKLEVDGHFRVRVSGSIPVVLKATDDTSAWRFSLQLNDTVSTYSGGIWKLIESAICNGIDWPVWWRQYDIDRTRYLDRTAGLLFLDDTRFPNEAAARAEKWRRVDLCLALGSLVSEDVHFPDFYETTSLVSAERIVPRIRWMDDFQLSNYVIKCFPRHRLFRIDETSVVDANFWQQQAVEFEGRGLVTSGWSIPLRVVLGSMSNSNLRQLLAEFGGKAWPRRLDNEETLYALCSTNPRAEEVVREAGVDNALRCKMPPNGVDWSELQAYRWQIRGMIGSLNDFLHNPQPLRRQFPTLFEEIFQESGLSRANCGFLF